MDSFQISEASLNLSSLVDRVNEPDGRPIFISADGKNKAVLMSVREYERLNDAALDREIDSVLDNFAELNESLSNK